VKLRSLWLGSALVALACGSSGTSSTGVGNPSVLSLSLVPDDADDELPGSAGGADAAAGSSSASGGSSGAGGNEAFGGAGSGEPGAVDAPLAKAQIHHALLSLLALGFLPCDPTLPIERVEGPFAVDLLESRTLPAIPAVPAVEGGYCGIDAELTPGPRGRSLLFDGVRADGTPFLLYANMQGTLRLRARAGSVWNALETPHLLWAFRPRRWLTASEIDSAESDPFDGARAIVIDLDRHPLLYGRIRARLAGNSRLYPDLNENGRLDSDERLRLLGEGLENTD